MCADEADCRKKYWLLCATCGGLFCLGEFFGVFCPINSSLFIGNVRMFVFHWWLIWWFVHSYKVNGPDRAVCCLSQCTVEGEETAFSIYVAKAIKVIQFKWEGSR
ncbi:hypothetical protein T12_4244 [Trichinella patagoniensis]|uniref:Transmembrane protein n=1 Tax=Trichinella patagoniensis TaxID=990121 RepID=A0A0V0Z614_9BILA|nr:hypothetical protein T12_4244 [Trichinella patagoniensis]